MNQFNFTIEALTMDDKTLVIGIGSDLVEKVPADEYGYVSDEHFIVAEAACRGNSEIERVIIEEGVVGVGNAAFMECANLKSVILPKGMIYIDYFAFHSCPELSEVIIPHGFRYIADDSAFINTPKLKGWTLAWEGEEIKKVSCVQNVFNIIVPEGVKIIREFAFSSCEHLCHIYLPKSLVEIEENAFWECSCLGTITIPESVKKIGEYAFAGCTELTKVIFEGEIPTIGEGAFDDCPNLETPIPSNSNN